MLKTKSNFFIKMFGGFRLGTKLGIAFGAAAAVVPWVLAGDQYAEYPANNPIEDRHTFFKVGDFHGGAVFDGHGGW